MDIVYVYNTETGAEAGQLLGLYEIVRALAFSPDDSLLAGCDLQGNIAVWSVADGALLLEGQIGNDNCNDLAWSPDGSLLVIIGWDELILWDTSTWEELSVLAAGATSRIAWSPDGTQLVVGDSRRVRLLTLTDDMVFASVEIDKMKLQVNDIVWSPDGTLWVSADSDNRVRLRSADDGSVLHVFEGHTGDVNGLDWSNDGRFIASASDDDTVRVWSVEKRELVTMVDVNNRIRYVQFTSDGQTIYLDSLYINIWDWVE